MCHGSQQEKRICHFFFIIVVEEKILATHFCYPYEKEKNLLLTFSILMRRKITCPSLLLSLWGGKILASNCCHLYEEEQDLPSYCHLRWGEVPPGLLCFLPLLLSNGNCSPNSWPWHSGMQSLPVVLACLGYPFAAILVR